MKAWIEFVPRQRTYAIRLVRDGRGSTAHAAVDVDQDRRIVWQEIEEREEVPPFLLIESGAFEALMAAAGEYTQSSDATVSHLKDAVGVRDRLLTLVERAWPV